MALGDLTFKLYTDSGLTSEFGGIAQFLHNSDLSDNPQDLQLWFGSNAVDVQLQANSSPGVDDITLTPSDIMPVWGASTAYAVGGRIQPTTGNTYVYEVQSVSGAGESDSSEPVWPTSIGSTIVDNEVTWVCVSKKHEPTEIKLASTAAGLDAAVAGAALVLGATLTSGVANAVEVNMRVENAVTIVGSNSGNPGIGVDINLVDETAV